MAAVGCVRAASTRQQQRALARPTCTHTGAHLDDPDARPRQIGLNCELPHAGVAVALARQRRRRRVLLALRGAVVLRPQRLLGHGIQRGTHAAHQLLNAAPGDRAAV